MRLLSPVLALTGVISAGGCALYALGDGRWSFFEALYFAVICASTVGFGEVPGLAEVPFGRVVTVGIILSSLGVVAYFQSALTTFLVQDVIGNRLRQRRMEKMIDSLEDHVVVAGAGTLGVYVISELVATRTPFVVIDKSRQHVESVARDLKVKVPHVVGDATQDATLLAAGIVRASGVIAALTEDRDNLYVTISARGLNAKARIVSKVVAPDATQKLMRAGANAVVSPTRIGGLRIASEMLRPTTVGFLDKMIQARGSALRFDEVAVPAGSWLVGKQLRDVPLRRDHGVSVVALYLRDDMNVNPPPDATIEAEMVLVVVGEVERIRELRKVAEQPDAPPTSARR
ncbi:MAG: potassium channel protein [Myxococcales bacterium]|nr:potassium channel protein [Myxococcales bacterium]